jgi:hypothetical protein
MSNTTMEESKQGSIFNLKSEDYIDLILIKSREYFLFTLEKQKIEFYSANTFKRTDSWDYFFERDLICCDKNKEGSKIFVSDKNGYTVLFNFLKHLDQSKENLVPCNRSNFLYLITFYQDMILWYVLKSQRDWKQILLCHAHRTETSGSGDVIMEFSLRSTT